MEERPVSLEEFRERLASLLVSGPMAGLPRRRRDRHILLRAVAMALGPGEERDRRSLAEGLTAWLAGTDLELDAVSLRRELVDYGYLERDAAGTRHVPRLAGRAAPAFAAEVDRIDVGQLLRAERRRIEAARRRPAARERRRIWDG